MTFTELMIAIIALCEIIRVAQNHYQISQSAKDNVYAEFFKSFKQYDSEFVKRILKEYEEAEE